MSFPFDFQRRRMSVIVEYDGDNVLICKGAVEEIYNCCSYYQIDEEIYPLINMIRADLFEEVEKLNREGFRVLGIAYREFPRQKTSFTIDDESQLILLGYIAFMDPPKDSATKAIELLTKRGVEVKVLTGDNGLVTEKVCRDVGIPFRASMTGFELASLSPKEFSEKVRTCEVFVKLTPNQKEQIVKELRRQGNVVGYMGDGINDATALKASDVGISVDSGVDVAKDAADIVLLEKSLLVLGEGIMEGRRIFANIIKYIRMGASSNFGNMLSVLGASFLLPFLLCSHCKFSRITSSMICRRQEFRLTMSIQNWLQSPLNGKFGNIKRFMLCIGPISSIFDYATFALMWFFFHANNYLNAGLSSLQRASLVSLFKQDGLLNHFLLRRSSCTSFAQGESLSSRARPRHQCCS